MQYGIGVIGLGDIAKRRHIPSIERDDGFRLAATASPDGARLEGVVQAYDDYRDMLAMASGLDAVAICTPPGVRHQIARDVLLAGKHVLLEKPPATTVAEAMSLSALGLEHGLTVFTAWHSQHNIAVERARAVLAGETIKTIDVRWHEDVSVYHAGQRWIWQPGGFGVLDAGVNPISILTMILPRPLSVAAATLLIPQNADTPVAATLRFASSDPHARLSAEFDWRSSSVERLIAITTGNGARIELRASGGQLVVDDRIVFEEARREYDLVYARFAELIRSARSSVDVEPLRIIEEALAVGERRPSPPVAV